jgi:hypothetical protein
MPEWTRSIRGFLKTINKNWLFIAAALIVLCAAAVYAGFTASKGFITNADALINVHLADNSGTPANDRIYVQDQHTLLFKFPLFAFQNLFTYDFQNVRFFSTTLLLVTAVGWCLLGAYALGKKTLPVIALGLAALLFAAPLLAGDLAYTTVRNIELVVALAFVIAVARFLADRKPFQKVGLWVTGGLYAVACVASDSFFIYIYSLGILLYLGLNWLLRASKPAKKRLLIAAAAVVGATLAGYVVKYLVHWLGLLNITTVGDTPLHTVRWDLLGPSIAHSVWQTMILFGADIFDKAITLRTLPVFLNFGLLVLSVVGYVLFLRAPRTNRYLNHFILLLIAISLMNYAMYIMGDRVFAHNGAVIYSSQGERYLVNVVLILIFGLGLLWLHKWRFGRLARGIMVGLLVVSIVVSGTFARETYGRARELSDHRVQRYMELTEVLKKENVGIIAGDHWYGATTKFWFEQTEDGAGLQFAHIRQCNVPVAMLSRHSWFLPDQQVKRSAYIFEKQRECTLEKLQSTYGKPVKQYTLPGRKGDAKIELYIYDYDIRSKMIIENLP